MVAALAITFLGFVLRGKVASFHLSLDCPGTESQDAGTATACQGCPNQGICASGGASVPDPGWYLVEKCTEITYVLFTITSGELLLNS